MAEEESLAARQQAQNEQMMAAQLAAVRQQQMMQAEQEAQEAQAGAAQESADSQIAALMAQSAPLRRKASKNYIGPFFLLLLGGIVIDVVGIIPVVDVAASILAGPYSVLRWVILHLYDFDSPLQKRVVNTVGPGLIEIIPLVNMLPLFTGFMIMEFADKNRRVSAAARKLNEINRQIAGIQGSLPR